MDRALLAKFVFFVAVAFVLTPWCSPPIALVIGALLALTIGNPFPAESKTFSRVLLQAAVVLLGFAMNLHKIIDAGTRGVVFALVSIAAVYLLGWALQRALRVRPITSLLVSTGTAICGGSAIAAMTTVLDAPQEDVSVSVGTVFLLNAVALLAFPPLGHALGLNGDQFGTWAGIAIHDVSSVVGAATAFGSGALATATAVKLSRVLYLIPITLIAAAAVHRSKGAKLQIPWFIGLFLLASVTGTYFTPLQEWSRYIKIVAAIGFGLALFLIGTGLTLKTLKQVGVRPLLQGIALWLFISGTSLFVAMRL